MTLCFATNNKHKLEEVRLAVGGNFIIKSLADINCFDELPETRDSFEGNAMQKAEYVFEKFGVACFADDSGLEVDALKGAPGVYSARYAGPQKNDKDNLQLLTRSMEGISNRTARFRTVIALIGIGSPKLFDGTIQGSIALEAKGTNGFGYDPVFIPAGFAATFAEMSLTDKNKISHRSQAVEKLVNYLRSI